MTPGAGTYEFQHGNAPQHTARRTKLWLQEHQDQLTVLPCPPKSTDLNVIENVRAIMAQELAKSADGRRLGAEELLGGAQQKWDGRRRGVTYPGP